MHLPRSWRLSVKCHDRGPEARTNFPEAQSISFPSSPYRIWSQLTYPMTLLEYPVLQDKVASTQTLVGRRVIARSIKRFPRNHISRNLFPNPTPIFVSGRTRQTQLPFRSLASVNHHRHHRHCLRISCPTGTVQCSALQQHCRTSYIVHTAHCNWPESLILSPNLPPRLASPRSIASKIENG